MEICAAACNISPSFLQGREHHDFRYDDTDLYCGAHCFEPDWDVSGFVVMYGLLRGKRLDRWTALFLLTTVLASATGFFFPSIICCRPIGSASSRCWCWRLQSWRASLFPLAGGWRRTYVPTAVMALYLNVFVLVVQSFLKVPALHAMAPMRQEPPFLVAQLLVLALFT